MSYEKSKYEFLFHDFFRKSCHLWHNVEKYGTDKQAKEDNIIRRMLFACWVIKDTVTHSEYLIIIAFQRQQLSSERATVLRH